MLASVMYWLPTRAWPEPKLSSTTLTNGMRYPIYTYVFTYDTIK